MSDYLPGAFGPSDLGVEASLLRPQLHRLQWASSPAPTSAAAHAALKAALTSYAPYTKAVAGVGVATRKGRTFAGPYLENAAFNPSVSPLQSAVVLAVLGGQSPADITEVAVAQTDNSPIDHAAAARLVLDNMAPGVVLRQYPIRVV